EELKQALLVDVANESYNIAKHLKYRTNEQYKVAANNALKYSFFDYKNIIEGTDLVEKDKNNGINNMLNKIFGKNGDITQERKKWWNKNKDCVRQAMLCGYHKCHTDSSIPPSEQLLPDDNDTSQYLYWIQEWYEDFCSKRKEIGQKVEKVCKDDERNYECNKCIEECKNYKEFLYIKKGEWKNQEKYYNNNYKSSQNPKTLQEYLKSQNTNFEGCDSTQNKSDLDNVFTKTYGDKESLCGCKKYDNIYSSHSGNQNCQGLLGNNETKWKDNKTADNKGIIHFRKLPENMYVSARRQVLCINGIDKIQIDGKSMDDKKEILRKHLLELAVSEGYNIGKYYKEKEKTNDTNSSKYSYSVKECNALKYSFYDFRNIVIGKDYLELREDQNKNATDT
ncbi:putative EMP1-like protein, partial [Plasmodium gaboni]